MKFYLPAFPFHFNSIQSDSKRYPPRSIKESKSEGTQKRAVKETAANAKKATRTSARVKREVTKKWCSERLINEKVADAVVKGEERREFLILFGHVSDPAIKQPLNCWCE